MSRLPLAKKELGQHWLEDTASLQAMVLSGNILNSDTVLEVGPGTGTLTNELINTGAEIICLEYDKQRFNDLSRRYNNTSNVKIIHGDIRKFDFNDLPKDYKIVANIPYYLTANLMRQLNETANKPAVAVLLVQKEVAERLSAQAGNLSMVAVFAQVYYKITKGIEVSAELFTPPPKVDSQIVILERLAKPLAQVDKNFEDLVKAGFMQKRKKLRTSLAPAIGVSKEDVEMYLKQANISLDARAQELTIADWQNLTRLTQNPYLL